MEDPVRFDLWAVVRPDGTEAAVATLRAAAPGLSELDARLRVSRSRRDGTFVAVARGVAWAEVVRVRADPPGWAAGLRCYQQGYSPADPPAGYCPRHDLFFGGCLGCHVCTGFFAAE